MLTRTCGVWTESVCCYCLVQVDRRVCTRPRTSFFLYSSADGMSSRSSRNSPSERSSSRLRVTTPLDRHVRVTAAKRRRWSATSGESYSRLSSLHSCAACPEESQARLLLSQGGVERPATSTRTRGRLSAATRPCLLLQECLARPDTLWRRPRRPAQRPSLPQESAELISAPPNRKTAQRRASQTHLSRSSAQLQQEGACVACVHKRQLLLYLWQRLFRRRFESQ